jgi:acyl-CoA synthetase (AMP-forming)/AMP-acid ligase II
MKLRDDQMPTLEDIAERALGQDAAALAIEFMGQWTTWGELRQVAEQVDQLLNAAGEDAPAVALVARNRPAVAAALFGLIRAGRTVQMVYPYQSSEGLLAEVDRLAATALVACAEDLGADLLEALRERGVAVISLNGADAAIASSPRPHAQPDRPRRRIETLTSGTTGPPKRFPLNYDLVAEHIVGAKSMFAGRGTADLQQTPTLFYAPIGNISGIQGLLQPLLNGDGVVMVDRFTVAGWRDYIRRYRPLFASMPAAGVQMVLDADVPVEELAGLTAISTGAAPLDPQTQACFEDRYGIPILFGYGATEFAGGVAAMTLELHAQWGRQKRGSAGRAAFGAQLRIVDPETGQSLPPGQEGLLEVLTPRVGPDWIRTSDLAIIDADGFLFHRGRADGAIVRGGFKLMPETIEQALLLHPSISAAAVIALPDHRLGQTPGAAIQLKPGAPTPSAADLEAHLRRHVYATHLPTVWRIVEALPRTAALKVDRPAVRRLFDSGPTA